jgi:hypothetical protein
MKIRELVESRQQLNEFAPLAALAPYLPSAVGWLAGASTGAIITWMLGAYSGYEVGALIRDIVRRDGSDPSRWSEESVNSVIVTAVATALGGVAAKQVIKTIVTAWPKPMRERTLADIVADIREKTTPKPNQAPVRTSAQATRVGAERGVAGGEDGIFNPG